MKWSDIPHLTHVPCDGRALLALRYYDADTGWYLYIPAVEADEAEVMPPGNWAWVECLYFAEKPESPDDLELPLVTFVAQHLSFPYILEKLYSLVHDIRHLAATLEKLDQFRKLQINESLLSFLVKSELENLFTLLRSMYDHVQKIAKGMGQIDIAGQKLIKGMNNLPESFADVLSKGEKQNLRLRTDEDLSKKYRLPEELLNFYLSECCQFLTIRYIRDQILHYGKSLPRVCVTSRGFGIKPWSDGFPIWSYLNVWQQHKLLREEINSAEYTGSVRAVAAFFAMSFLRTLNRFEHALRGAIDAGSLPPAISAGRKVYLRYPVISRLSNANLVAVCSDPWD